MSEQSAGVTASRLGLLALLIGYLIVGALYATRTPAWQAPDEPAHYNVIAQIAAHGCCPVIEPGDWDQAYLDQIKAARFAPEAVADGLDSVQYEDWQPPLYYLLAAPLFSVTEGNLTALRLFSVALGTVIVAAAWAVARLLFPGQGWLAVGAGAFVAFLPQHVAILGSVNNDSLAWALAALILLLCVRHVLRGSAPRLTLLAGGVLGLGFLTKLSVYPLAAILLLAIALRARHDGWPFGRLLRESLTAFIPAILLGSFFWLGNLTRYGWPDFLAQTAHDRVVVGQLRTAERIAQIGTGGWLSEWVRTTFQSFWGQFGWMGVPMTDTIYAILLALGSAALLGLLLNAFIRRGTLDSTRRDGLILLGATAALALLVYIYYNLTYVQFQGRYLFTALIPVGLGVAGGLGAWLRLFVGRLPLSARNSAMLAGMSLFALGTAAFALYALFRIIVPALAT